MLRIGSGCVMVLTLALFTSTLVYAQYPVKQCAQRSPSAPEYPTVSEAGLKGYDATSWYGPMVPAGTPREIISRLAVESSKLVKQPDVRERLIASGVDPVGSTSDEYGAYVRSEVEKWAKVIKTTGAKAD